MTRGFDAPGRIGSAGTAWTWPATPGSRSTRPGGHGGIRRRARGQTGGLGGPSGRSAHQPEPVQAVVRPGQVVDSAVRWAGWSPGIPVARQRPACTGVRCGGRAARITSTRWVCSPVPRFGSNRSVRRGVSLIVDGTQPRDGDVGVELGGGQRRVAEKAPEPPADPHRLRAGGSPRCAAARAVRYRARRRRRRRSGAPPCGPAADRVCVRGCPAATPGPTPRWPDADGRRSASR